MIWKLLFPPKCVLCGKILEKGQIDLCDRCRIHGPVCTKSKIKLPFLDSWLALWHYEEDVRRSLLRYKFYGKRHLAKNYGRLLADKLLREREADFDMITWVPVSRMRRLRRGYDQVELLAKALGEALEMEPVKCLRKIRRTQVQSRLTGQAQRRANVLGAYEVIDSRQVVGMRVLLLDDIITTGATAGECARVLLTAGASEVHCAAVASAIHYKNTSR